MTNYVKIAGNPKIGIVVLGDDGAIRNLNTVEPASAWTDSKKAEKNLPGKFSYISTTGTATGTTTVANEQQVAYLTALGNLDAKWKEPKPLPANVKISGVAGDPAGGYMLLGDDGKTFYQISTDGKEWKASTAALPFDGTAVFIAGDIKAGVLAISGASEIARSTSDCCGWTAVKPDAPVEVEFITGDITKGFVVYGEGQLYTLAVGKDAAWTPIPTPKFQFHALSGNPGDGLAAVICDSSGNGNMVVYNVAPAKGPWSLALAPQKPADAKPVTP